MSKFTPKLTQMFEQIEPAWREAMVASYIGMANRQLEAWLKLLDGPEPVGRSAYGYHRDRIRVPEYVLVTGGSYRMDWPGLQEDRHKGVFQANLKKAEKDANDSVDYAKLQFVGKQSQKLENATKNHAGEPKIGGYLRHDTGLITGGLKVEFDGGDEFLLTMNIITNYRYNDRRGSTTSFHQFPSRFTSVKLRGEPVKARMSEGWMETNFK